MTRGAANAVEGERRRDEILAFLARFEAEHGHHPTVREIGKGVGLESPGPTFRHLQRLLDEGKVRKVKVSSGRDAYTVSG